MVSLLKTSGCTNIIATARTQSKLDLARKLGADQAFNPEGPGCDEIVAGLNGSVDFVFECSGAQSAFTMAINLLKARGELVIVSLPQNPIEFPAAFVANREISIVGSKCTNGEFPMVAELLSNKSIIAEDIITKKIYLDDLEEEGFKTLIKDNEQLKILVTPKRENLQ